MARLNRLRFAINIEGHDRVKVAEEQPIHLDEALRVSEQRLRAAFHQAAVGMAMLSLEGRFEEINARFGDIFGYHPEDLKGRTFLDLSHPHDLAKSQDLFGRLIAGEIPKYMIEKRFIRKDGGVVWGLSSVTLLRDRADCPDKLVAVVEDITQRKRAEEAAQEAAQRLQLALSAGSLGDWSWDARTDLVSLGAEACRIFGLPEGCMIGWGRLRETLHPDDRERAGLAVEQALNGKSDYSIEYRVRRKDKWTWIAAQGRGIYDSDGKTIGMVGVVRDITRRKESEEIGSRLAAVVESSDDAIISMELNTIITTWNRGAERMFGYTAAEAVGKSVTMLIPEDSEDEEPKILQRILDGERVDHYETIRRRKDGGLINVSLTVSPVYDGSGQIIGVSKISRDITERKRSEEALRQAQAQLRRHAEKLEEEVAERTSRLRETIHELEAFSYSVSHDMRSPLRAMQGYSDALLEDHKDNLDPTAQEYLQRIRRAASRMDLLIQDVLAYSRVAKGEIQLGVVNLENVIHDVIQNYPALQPDKADISVPSLPLVLGHEAYLTQIVSNLLTNAVKFVAPGVRPKVDIRAQSEGDMVRIDFQDNGIGIAPEHQKQVFQIFGRVYSDKKYEGTGIGLAIVKKAAERMGGLVGLVSEPGRGSRFFVQLKRAK